MKSGDMSGSREQRVEGQLFVWGPASAVASCKLTCYQIILDKGKLSCFVTPVVIGTAEQDVEVVNLE